MPLDKTALLAYLRDAVALLVLAVRCEAARLLGIGNPDDYCGSCVKCAVARGALLAIVLVVWTQIVGIAGLLISVAIWLAWVGYTGRGVVGRAIHTLLWP